MFSVGFIKDVNIFFPIGSCKHSQPFFPFKPEVSELTANDCVIIDRNSANNKKKRQEKTEKQQK